ncbi:MAG: transketolase [Chloroflexi bacterium]|nr:transketolase [Chloroflexota bacterium]
MEDLIAPREAIGTTLVELGRTDKRIFVIDCDLARSTRITPFEKEFPDRFVQLGSAEENAVSFACGLAYVGFKPVFVSFTIFSIGLPWTQLRMAAYSGLPLIIIGTHPGFDIGPDGGTHQMFEDIALARVIPEFIVMSPCDVSETREAIKAAMEANKPCYIRVGRDPVPDFHKNGAAFQIGKSEVIFGDGEQCIIIADGSMVAISIEVASILEKMNIRTSVINIRTIKPLDHKLINEKTRKAKLIVTIENHSVHGGLGGLIAEFLSENPIPHIIIGSPDQFGESGKTDELRKKYHLDLNGILKKFNPYIKAIIN